MLEIVSKGFEAAKNALTGRTTLTAENIDAAVRQIRVALLEGDVELGVAKAFLSRVKAQAIGEIVELSAKKAGKKMAVTPGDHFIAICQKQLVALLGPVDAQPIAFRKPLTQIMMVGLQGAGKTTTCGKLARYLLSRKRRPLLVAADIARPAAVTQLQILGEKLKVPVFFQADKTPTQLCTLGLAEARRQRCDVVIYDTAGRLSVDEPLMQELEDIKAQTKPHNIFLVCDAMAGQDAVRTAHAFDRRLDLSGFILTKFDGDARGGAALSIKEVTGKAIKFLGVGEGLDKLESFRPEGLASRILGMGDLVGLMQDFEQAVDEKQAVRETKKMLQGQFTLEDFWSQLRTLKKMGSIKDLLGKMPLPGAAMPATVDEKVFVRMESMLQSMTPKERQQPDLLTLPRQLRVAKGSGRKPEEVKQMLEQFGTMKKMLGGLKKDPGMLGGMPQLGGKRGGRGAAMAPRLAGGGAGGQAFGGLLPRAPMAVGPAGASAAKQRDKNRSKRKAEKKARKKARR